MGCVVGASTCDAHQTNIQRMEQIEKGFWLGQINTCAAVIRTKRIGIRLITERLRFARAIHAGSEGDAIECTEAYPDVQTRCFGTNALYQFTQESGAVFKTTAVA